MFAVTLICVGKLKEKFYLAASEEYAKRLRGYVDFTLIELPETRLPDDPSPAQIAQGLAKEAELIRARIPKGAWFCVLTPEGTQLSSEELAAALTSLRSGLTPDAVLCDVEAAMEALGEVTGRTVREDIVNRIFERFCVGK